MPFRLLIATYFYRLVFWAKGLAILLSSRCRPGTKSIGLADLPLVQQRLLHWQQDVDLIGIRGDAVSKLPELEREGWQKLGEDAEAMRKRATDKK